MTRKLYEDCFAKKLQERAGEKYRPSNGTEGLAFDELWCEHCWHDQYWRNRGHETGEGDKSCQIICRVMCYDLDDDEYPSEWVYGPDGQPQCTAFVPARGHR